jgi:hypothetical protein
MKRALFAALLALAPIAPAGAQGLGSAAPFVSIHPGYVAGKYYNPFLYGLVTGAAITPGANKITCNYGYVARALTISELAAAVVTDDAGKKWQLAVYSTGVWGRPAALLASTADIVLAGAANVSAAAAGQVGGPLWFCINTESTVATWRSVSSGNSPMTTAFLGSTTLSQLISTTTITGITIAQTYGTWPATFGSTASWAESTQLTVPWIAFKVGSVP